MRNERPVRNYEGKGGPRWPALFVSKKAIHEMTNDQRALLRLWFTLPQLTRIKAEGLPLSETGWRILAQRENWRRRKRSGRGGGFEYHIDSFPSAARCEILENNFDDYVDICPDQTAARLVILETLDKMAEKVGIAQARRDFADMSRTGALPPQMQLTVRAAKVRNTSSSEIAVPTLKRWSRIRRELGDSALETKSIMRRPGPWIEPFMHAYRQECLSAAHRVYDRLKNERKDINWPRFSFIINRINQIEGDDCFVKSRRSLGEY